MISFACHQCGMKLKVKPEFACRSSLCPTCKQPLTVPSADLTQAYIPQEQIDGTPSSIARSGLVGGVTLDQETGPRGGQQSVKELLARQGQGGERYAIAGEIARGGMGAVLRAVDRDIRREVAVKYMLDEADPQKKLRFVEEAQITGQLEHPNIPPVHELGIDKEQRLFFSMKMVKGRSLAQILDDLRENPQAAEKEYPLARLLNIFVNVCNGLAYAHARNVVHRDLKPANIMVGDFGETYVMDWGLAKVLNGDGQAVPLASVVAASAVAVPTAAPTLPSQSVSPKRSSKVVTSREGEADLTQEGAVLGTPVYMPPEQATGKVNEIDNRSDIYSLGAILYELLTLQPPIDKAGGYLAVLMRVMQGEIVPPEQRDPKRTRAGKVPKELAAVAMKAMAKEPRVRYPNVEALRKDIERFQAGRSVSAKDDTFREAAWKLVKRNKQASFTASLAVLVLAAVIGFSFRAVLGQKSRAEDALARVESEQSIKRERGKTSAPFFAHDAKVSADSKRLDYALAQVNVALEYDPDLTDARLLKGQVLIVTKDFAAARSELELYRRHRPADQDAARLIELCEKARPQDSSNSAAFAEVLVRQKEFGLAAQMEQDRDKLLFLYRKQIEAAWPGLGKHLLTDKEGKCKLYLNESKEVTDLAPLQGIPLTTLSLVRCTEVRNLSPLKGMLLTELNLDNCRQVQDLTPLKGMPLAKLDLRACTQVRDLSPLQGMPLTSLNLGDCKLVRDLTPLQGLPLTSLELIGCGQVSDLTPLKGLPLTWLNLHSCPVSDLTPLKGMPLTNLSLYRCDQVKDLTPLRGMDLIEITFTPSSTTKGMDVLRQMKSLKSIRLQDLDKKLWFSPDDFFQKYDAGEFK